MYLIKKVALCLLVTLLNQPLMTNAQTSLLDEILNRRSSSPNQSAKIDVAKELIKYVPAGTTVDDAIHILKLNGFVVTSNRANGSDYLTGRMELNRTILGFDEIRLTMLIFNGLVSTSSGSIFFNSI